MNLLNRQRLIRFRTRGKHLRRTKHPGSLSFLLLLFLLGVFGCIVLFQLLSLDAQASNPNAGNHANCQDEAVQQYLSPSNSNRDWATATPIILERQQQSQRRTHPSARLHEDEMESLIRNMSESMESSAQALGITVRQPTKKRVSHVYQDWEFVKKPWNGYESQWQPVNGTKDKFYVYSAYYDSRSRDHRMIRVIGATRTKKHEKVWCKFFYNDQVAVVPAGVSSIRENWNLKYSAVFVLCPLGSEPTPTSLSIVMASNNSVDTLLDPTNWLRVLNTEYDHTMMEDQLSKQSEIGVCVKPIHFHYSDTQSLIEFIELNRLLGATKFTFYNASMSKEISQVLQCYSAKGLVQVYPWHLNIASQSEIRTQGLFAALNDCLYRNMYQFNYLMLIDLDEFIVPKSNATLPAMLAWLNSQKSHILTGESGLRRRRLGGGPRVTSSYSFQNAFFYTQFEDDKSAEGMTLKLRTLVKTRRKSKLNPHKQRSKYICVPRRVREVGNHFVWEFLEGFNLNVPVSAGFLHHYRVCEFGGDDCIKTESKVDRSISTLYKDRLLSRVARVMNHFSLCDF